MGTPEFAIPSLQALIQNKFEIPMVVTQPDRPSGRGRQLTPPAIKTLALKNNLPVFQPENLRKNESELQTILNVDFDFLIVAAFGQILPKKILEHPKVAPLNVHASILPAYRGAAPIARSILEGESETGVTIQWVTEALDMGDILHIAKSPITEEDTSLSLHDKLKDIGAKALIECLSMFANHSLIRTPQDPRVGSYAEKLSKQEASLDFAKPAFEVHRQIMGLNPWPVAECLLIGKKLRVFRSQLVGREPRAEPGTVVDTSEGSLVVACSSGCVALTEVQMENKKRMASADFLKGQKIPEGMVLGQS